MENERVGEIYFLFFFSFKLNVLSVRGKNATAFISASS